MFGNTALDVAISLIFIYLLYSLLASIIQEIIARIFNLRARFLTKALRRILDNDPRGNPMGWLGQFTFFTWFYELGWSVIYFFAPFKNSPFLKKFYTEPGIHSLGESKSSSRPSYISPQLFSQTLMHLLRGPGYDSSTQQEAALVKQNLESGLPHLGQPTRSHLLNLLEDAQRDAERFRNKVEQWFDEVMARTSGWYRKQIQLLLIIIGFIIAWQFNVDSIAITRILTKDKKAREQLVTLATQRYELYGQWKDSLKRTLVIKQDTIRIGDSIFVKPDTVYQVSLEDAMLDSLYRSLSADAADIQNILGINRGNCKDTATTDTAYTQIHQRLDSIAGKLLSAPELQKYKQAMQTVAKRKAGCYTHPYQQNGWLVFLGWVITALAVSLGAPFWFDLLNRVVKIRTGGPQVTTTTVQQTK